MDLPNESSYARDRAVAVVVTSIAGPIPVLREIANATTRRGIKFVVIGDTKSPDTFELEGCDFYSVERQLSLGFQTSALTPTRHYARKNIGYLVAIRQGAQIILETDDDNLPSESFYEPLPRQQAIPVFEDCGWINVYRYYTDNVIWPRGFPLDSVLETPPKIGDASVRVADCPIQQGLADENPDVDALYRLLFPLPQHFRSDVRRLGIGTNAWCPFNSQNTVFYKDAFPLLYLPAYCSFRMTDIWRSFVAERICWINGWTILFREPNVVQERNDHNLMKDFEDEIPGYLNNRAIVTVLAELKLEPGVANIPQNMRTCYAALVTMGVVGSEEIPLLDAWLGDLAAESCLR